MTVNEGRMTRRALVFISICGYGDIGRTGFSRFLPVYLQDIDHRF
jgi:hypothetical protein